MSQNYVHGTTILVTDLEFAPAVAEVDPMMETDQLTVDGKPVVTIGKMQIPAAGTPVAYRLIVRA